jgi:hypothetical protein
VNAPRPLRLFDSVRLRTGEVERITHVENPSWVPVAGAEGVLVHEHEPGVFEAELFAPGEDAKPAVLAVVTSQHVELADQE